MLLTVTKFVTFLTFLNLNCELVHSSKILFYVSPLSSYSHRHGLQPLANKLAERGHDVTFISPYDPSRFQLRHPSIKEICPDGIAEMHNEIQEMLGVEGLQERIEKKFSNGAVDQITQFFGRGQNICRATLGAKNIQVFLKKEKEFDLMIIDNALNDCAFGIAHYLKAKTILSTPVPLVFMWDIEMLGQQAEISWVPGFASTFEGEMTFWDRLLNAFSIVSMGWVYQNYHLPEIDRIIREGIGERGKGMKYIKDLIQDTSLVLVQSHPSDSFPRAYPPFVVNVGGMTIDEMEAANKSAKTLPKEITKFIEGGGEDGFIYISFGSLVRFSTAPPQLAKAIFDSIEKSPNLRFLWKWEGTPPEHKLKNLLLQPWFPQIEILSHSKLRAFVTQGGQVSIQQAIRSSVPLIVFPVTGDQNYNAKRIEQAGNGIAMELYGLTFNDLQKAFKEITTNKMYKLKAIELDEASRDRPMSGLDTAVWWAEYVIRSNSTAHLKPGNMYQPLWLQWSLDIFFFAFVVLLTVIVFVLLLVKFAIKLILRILFKSKGQEKHAKQNGKLKAS